jgi:hypothetical protein
MPGHLLPSGPHRFFPVCPPVPTSTANLCSFLGLSFNFTASHDIPFAVSDALVCALRAHSKFPVIALNTFFAFVTFKTGSHYVTQTGLKLSILLLCLPVLILQMCTTIHSTFCVCVLVVEHRAFLMHMLYH